MTHDLTGRWTGIFNYPHTHPPTAFEAEIADNGGSFGGTIAEPDLFSTPPGAILTATIDGSHEDGAVRFGKFYDGEGRDYDMVAYTGTLNADGSEIAGRWTIAGVWSGTFLMVRPEAVAAEQSQEIAEPTDAAAPVEPTVQKT